jgi:hypothetical protein
MGGLALTGDAAEAFARRFELGSLCNDEVAASCEIEAPRDYVWSVLSDFRTYPDWNPFTPGVEGELAVGQAVTLDVRFEGKKARRQVEWVNRVEPGSVIYWGVRYGSRKLLAANRAQELTELSPTRTRYYTVDRFSGVLVPLVFALYGDLMRRGFEGVATGLKRYCEATYRA